MSNHPILVVRGHQEEPVEKSAELAVISAAADFFTLCLDWVRSTSSCRVRNATAPLKRSIAVVMELFARNWPELFTASTTSNRQHSFEDWIGRQLTHRLTKVVGQGSDERFAVHLFKVAHPSPSKSQLVQVGERPFYQMRTSVLVGQVGRSGVALPGPGDGLVMGTYRNRSS